MNAARVDVGYADGSIVLRTGTRSNNPGAFVGPGSGNKAIFGAFGFHNMPLSALTSLSFTWANVVGPAGPHFSPPGLATVCTPYVNLVVNFAGTIRLLVLLSDQLNPAISAAIGSYANPSLANVLTYSWTSAQGCLIVASPPLSVPGGIAPIVHVGGGWLERAYAFADLVAANPGATLVDAYPADNGMPAGAVMPAVLLMSGDSGNLNLNGKRVYAMAVNGTTVVPWQWPRQAV